MKQPLLVLASGSPRRAELLRQIGLRFQILPSHVPEPLGPGPAWRLARRLALAKALATVKILKKRAAREKGVWVLGADTVVAQGRRLLGKPKDAVQAQSMLKRLAGAWHEVVTAVALCPLNSQQKSRVFHVKTKVLFRSLSAAEISAYVASGEPMDKAGAYGIQGRAGAFVKELRGDYFNVVGLPLASFSQIWAEISQET